jgi:glycine C-acetyltransferase
MAVGHEFVGQILKVGSNVADFFPGDIVGGEGHVVCGRCRNCLAGRRHLCAKTYGVGVNRPGCFAEYISLPMTNIWKHSNSIDLETAAIFDPFGNAVHSALSFDVLGEDVLITGAGPIGIMAAAVVRHAGARYVVITDVNPYRLELAKKVGVTLAVDARETALKDVQKKLGMKEGFDVGLEMSGNPAAFRDMLANMCHGGKIALLGIPNGEVSIDWNTVIFNMLTIKGIYGREMYETWYKMTVMLFETLLDERDAVISDELNHASIIDGIRLSKAKRFRYRNSDMQELEARLREAQGARRILIATDGVFSMDGYIAKLPEICDLAERYGAMVMVDDSHAVGFLGEHGRGTPEYCGVNGRVDILTGTLGKAMGGACGGYTAARREIVELLRQRSRPYLFSNSLPPVVVATTLKVLDLIERSGELRRRLWENTRFFREGMTKQGWDILPGEHPIVPVMIGDAVRAVRLAEALLAKGVYVVAFSYPVVPQGKARIRVQISAAHSREDLEFAMTKFAEAKSELGL